MAPTPKGVLFSYLVGVVIVIALANANLLSCLVYLLINDESAANKFANCLCLLYLPLNLYLSLSFPIFLFIVVHNLSPQPVRP